MSKHKKKPKSIRDRIKELRRVKASDLVRNPKNYRRHPDDQRSALRGIIDEVGYADALIVRELEDGRLMLIDGEARADTTPDDLVPVLVLDVSEAEADKLLAVLDPMVGMAEIDEAALELLLSDVTSTTDEVAALLAEIGGEEAEPDESRLRNLDVKPPPKMSWVLVGIPTVHFGSISELVEKIAAVENTIVESTANDG